MFYNFFIIILSVFFLCVTGFAEVPVLDENGNETGLINVNPDPEGEPWISGGGRGLTAEEEKCIPELVLPERYKDRVKYQLPEKVDNSRTKYFPPIFSQKGASCCQASGVSYAFNYEICRIRDVDAADPENIYPYGFSYNFINKGSTSTYSGYFDGWRMSEELGLPNLEDYDAPLQGTAGQTSWLDGYDNYYRAMRNRYITSYKINSESTDGIEKMRQWLFDHADGSEYGGVLCFLAWSGQTKGTLPSNSPEAGHTYVEKFGTSGGHCMTIVGYHDEIFFDLNRNGTIEPQENGGFLMVNSYGTSYGTDGRAYIPYTLFTDGSMKSSNVHGITVQEEFEPLITYKVTITHSERDAIEIIRGFSTNLSATTPSKEYTYRECFSNGGALPMLGKGLGETIEVGLDVSAFVEELAGEKAKFFLQIDSDGGGSGKVNSFSVLDYTGAQVKEYECTQTDVNISSGMTTLSVVCDATGMAKGTYKTPYNSRPFYVSPLTTGNDILFKFAPQNTRQAIFRIVTIHGRLVYEKTFTINSANTFSWDVTNNAGTPVANGKYIAQLELVNKNGGNKTLYIKFYVMK